VTFTFRVSLSVAFLLITVPLLLAIIGVLYFRNAELARDLARESMNRAAGDITNDIEVLLRPLVRVLEATATLGKIDRGALRRPDGFQYYLKVLESTPQAESLYVGFARDGSFYQATRLPSDQRRFGPSGRIPAPDARYALRILDASSGEMADSFIYLAKWGEVVAVERSSVQYDPRERPWYVLAWQKPGPQVSDAYVFFSSGRPGITLSQRIATDEGIQIGSVGVDISLELLSEFLARERVGARSVAFIVDDSGYLIGYPDPEKVVRQSGDQLALVKAGQIDDPRVAQAINTRDSGGGDRFTMTVDEARYLVSFARLPNQFGKVWQVGVIAAEDDFVGSIRRTSLFMLGFGGAVTMLSILAILWVARSMTRPIWQIVNETKRVREFNLDGGSPIHSRIVEIDELGRALEAMEEGLRSFGAYIPKALVRGIVASGKSVEIGGERKSLTILFSDIENFTQQSEMLEPENVLDQLSTYLDVMSRCLHEHGGTVDKFIGDAVMALWNAPMDDPDHALNACRAVLRCRSLNAELNARFIAEGCQPLFTRFGLHTGDVVVGNVGSIDRMQYTALGASVNLASRVENLNKRYGTQLLVTGTVQEQAGHRFLFKPVDIVVPSGTSQPVQIFELIGELGGGMDRAPDPMIEQCREWQYAIDVYRDRNWPRALDLFKLFAQHQKNVELTRLYIERCTKFCKAPPPKEWDGAEHFDSK
jgi:adenylate cyclase